MRELPQGWISIPLSECGIWLSGGTPSTSNPIYWNGDIPWISAASLKKFYLRDSERRITPLGVAAGTRMAPKGAVLFVVRGMSLKSEFRVGVSQRDLSFGQDCKAIIPKPGVDGTFLGLALKARSNSILGMVDEAGHGTGRLPTDMLSRLIIDIPPFKEQRQIVEIIDAVNARQRSTERLAIKLRAIRHAVLRQSITPGIEPLRTLEASQLGSTPRKTAEGWTIDRLGEHISKIDAGKSPDLEDTPAGPGEWGVLKVSSIREDLFFPEENKVVRTPSLFNETLCVHSGDLLMSRANTAELVGLACIVEKTPPQIMLCDKTLRLHVDNHRTPTEYINLMLGVAEVRRQIEIAATGTSGSMKNISQDSIKKIMIPVPRRTEIERITQIDAEFRTKLALLNQESSHLDCLKQGLLSDLLTGRVHVSSID